MNKKQRENVGLLPGRTYGLKIIKKHQKTSNAIDYRKKDQGNALSWIVVLGTIFICALAYIIFTPVMYQLKVLANATGVNVSSGTTGGNIFATFEYWPMIVIVGMIIWAFVLAQKKEPDSGMYY